MSAEAEGTTAPGGVSAVRTATSTPLAAAMPAGGAVVLLRLALDSPAALAVGQPERRVGRLRLGVV
jgi:hypothetical protein